MNIEELAKKVENNARRLDENAAIINKNVANIGKNLAQINANSYALDILKGYKGESKRLFILLIIVLGMWFATIGYLVYVLNDTGIVEETTTVSQDNQNGYNNYIGNDGDITNGKADN